MKKILQILNNYFNTLKSKKKPIYRIKKIYKKLKSREKIIKNQQILISNKEKALVSKFQSLQYQEESLKEYINKLFEQQEIDRIVKWLVDSIRESLDLDIVLSKTVEEIGNLLNIDRCLVAIYNKNLDAFNLENEYVSKDTFYSEIGKERNFKLPSDYFKVLMENKYPIAVEDSESLKNLNLQHIVFDNSKSVLFVAIIDNFELLGLLIASQTSYEREWDESHKQMLQNIADQIAIAIRHAFLFSEVQKSINLKNEFIANMSHEFRTPLNAIIGFSEMLSSENFGRLTDKQREYIKNIYFSGKHLLALINDILDLSKAESGNLELFYEKFSTNDVIKETIAALDSMLIKKNLKLDLNLCNGWINADSSKFKQIMYNILSNAIKFTPENGGIKVNSEILGKSLKVEVEDTGIGISIKNKEKVFAKFKQLESSYSRQQEGTGLGLSLTKKLIELHQGCIDFESELGKGSKFWFVLPNAELME